MTTSIRVLIACLCILGVGIVVYGCLNLSSRPIQPDEVRSKIPLGIGLNEFDRYLQTLDLDAGDVFPCTHEGGARLERSLTLNDSMPCPDDANLGPYDRWKASLAVREQFSGRILFYSGDLLMNKRVFQFTFVNGRVRKIDWGNLPG